jgi:membrane fusion protein (multidrug efflux system)
MQPNAKNRAKEQQGKSVPAPVTPPPMPPYLRHWPTAAGVAAAAAIAAAAYFYLQYSSLHPSTDNAYVQANVVQVTPVLSGKVAEVPVRSFDQVKSGDVLVKLDTAQLDATLKMAQDRLKLAQAQKQNIEEAQAGVQRAQQELDNATIKAPVDGILGKVSVRPGTLVRAGAPLFPIIDNAHWWVDANFKETDLTRIHAGEKATVSLDIYPDKEFTGEVEALSPVSTSAFSLLPPENATGSWIKLTQRFPVRVSLKLKPDDPPMRIGASATVMVDTTDPK